MTKDAQILHTKLQNMTDRNKRIPKQKVRYILLMHWNTIFNSSISKQSQYRLIIVLILRKNNVRRFEIHDFKVIKTESDKFICQGR